MEKKLHCLIVESSKSMRHGFHSKLLDESKKNAGTLDPPVEKISCSQFLVNRRISLGKCSIFTAKSAVCPFWAKQLNEVGESADQQHGHAKPGIVKVWRIHPVR